jgi:arginine deiminase
LEFGYPEYRRLRKVLMHRPGKELNSIHPKTYKKLLFGDAIDQEQFRRDHQQYVETLRAEGIDVLLITDLLRNQGGLLSETERLPNLLYTRDTAAVTGHGYILTRMKDPVRRKETAVVEESLRQLSISALIKTRAPGTMEGGDIIFLDEETVLVGIGNRTNQNAVQQLAHLGEKSGLRRLIAVPLPPWVIHLDGTMMPIDADLCILHVRSLKKPATLLENGKHAAKIRLPEFLKEQGMSLVEVTDYERQRRATNILPIRPRKAVAYDGNARVRRALERHGVDLIEIPGSELIRGSGGPRCMTAAILREV